MGIRIVIECDTLEDLVGMVSIRDQQRDSLRDRVNALEQNPLAYSLSDVAARVIGDGRFGLTPDQQKRITNEIVSYRPKS